MNEYIQAFTNGSDSVSVDCDLTNVYGRITNGITDDDFSRLSQNPHKRFAWMFDHQTLRSFLGLSHMDMLINSGHTLQWIDYKLKAQMKFKLIICKLSPDQVKLATWDNIFELLSEIYPEIDRNNWYGYANELKQLTLKEIDPEGTIVRNYFAGPNSDGYLNTERFLNLKEPATLVQVRGFLHNHIGLNELFRGDGRTETHGGNILENEYLTKNRSLNELNEYTILDLNPISR